MSHKLIKRLEILERETQTKDQVSIIILNPKENIYRFNGLQKNDLGLILSKKCFNSKMKVFNWKKIIEIDFPNINFFWILVSNIVK